MPNMPCFYMNNRKIMADVVEALFGCTYTYMHDVCVGEREGSLPIEQVHCIYDDGVVRAPPVEALSREVYICICMNNYMYIYNI